VADHQGNANLRTLRNAWSGLGYAANATNDFAEPVSDRFCNRWTRINGVVGGNRSEIGKCLARIDELHTEPNFAKAAVTSASVAASPLSIEAVAASIIR